MLKESGYKIAALLLDFCIFILYNISVILFPAIRTWVTKILRTNGIEVNGKNSYDPQVTDLRFYCELFVHGMPGIGFAYERGYFDCPDLISLYNKVYHLDNYRKFRYHPSIYLDSLITKYLYVNSNNEDATATVAEREDWPFEEHNHHYNRLSIGYWKNAENNHQAHIKKFDLIAEGLKLKDGMRVLDVGCGEGHFCKYLAEKYDVKVVGLNTCKRQASKARKVCEGLNVEIEQTNYMNVDSKFDRVVCIGVLMHLGISELKVFFRRMHQCLNENGLIVVETLVNFNSELPVNDSFIDSFNNKVTFANVTYLTKAVDGLFALTVWQNVSKHALKTFEAAVAEIDEKISELESKIEPKKIRLLKGAMCTYSALQTHHVFDTSIIAFSKREY